MQPLALLPPSVALSVDGVAIADSTLTLLRRTTSDWREKAEGSGIPELTSFAQGIRLDEAAVSAAVSQEWSNGPVGGAVNRLKTIKRQMYGRAGFTLLRARVLHAG